MVPAVIDAGVVIDNGAGLHAVCARRLIAMDAG